MIENIQVVLRAVNSGRLKASAEVTLNTEHGPVTIPDWKVVSKDGQKPWVGKPSKQYIKNGETKYIHTIEPSKPLMRAISLAILEAYEEGPPLAA